MKVRDFEIDHIPMQYQDLTIDELHDIDWPLKPVIEHINQLLFMINPIEMATHFFLSLGMAGKKVSEIAQKPINVDFDTLFPTILICILASDIVYEPRIFLYIASNAQYFTEETECQFGCSYMEALMIHILNLQKNS